MIIVGCEKSGVVRRALRARGLDAYSVDIEPSEDNSPHHIQDDIFVALKSRAWKRGIVFPECTFMSVSGAKQLYENHGQKPLIRNPDRWDKLYNAAMFKKKLLDLNIPIVSENPKMMHYAMQIVGRKYFCKTQPYYHGDKATKETYFWRNCESFKPLIDTNRLILPEKGTIERKEFESVWREPPGKMRKANRSRFFPDLADAIASQWF